MTEAEFQSLLGWLGELTTEQVTTLRQALRRRDGLAQVAAIFERGQDGACPPCVHCGGESRLQPGLVTGRGIYAFFIAALAAPGPGRSAGCPAAYQ